MKTFAVFLEEDNYGTTIPVDSKEVQAQDSREAERAAARSWGLKPHQWCFEHSPFKISSVEQEG